MANPHTYHCLCSTFILATNYDLVSLPTRAGLVLDKASILPLHNKTDQIEKHTVLQNVTKDRQPTVVRREDGLEKRFILRCRRCNLGIGYHLDQTHFKDAEYLADDIAYVLPGALLSTEDTMEGKMPPQPEWAENTV